MENAKKNTNNLLHIDKMKKKIPLIIVSFNWCVKHHIPYYQILIKYGKHTVKIHRK